LGIFLTRTDSNASHPVVVSQSNQVFLEAKNLSGPIVQRRKLLQVDFLIGNVMKKMMKTSDL